MPILRFSVTEFIEATGIAKLRQAYQEREEQKRLKQKQREKMQPKMGKMDIDYQVLHDAFFKFQTKPKLTVHGDLYVTTRSFSLVEFLPYWYRYYEGKEFELRLKEKKPGQLSEELKVSTSIAHVIVTSHHFIAHHNIAKSYHYGCTSPKTPLLPMLIALPQKALGMPPGAPPPWLVNMQRYGPPPSYPSLKVQGLNAPIPEGGQWGYHPGGWGKPPVDELGRPLYGDVFGTTVPAPPPEIAAPPIERKKWGELEEVDEEEEEMLEVQGDEEEPAEEQQEADESGLASVTSGLETPDTIELRKVKKVTEPLAVEKDDGRPKQLFTVLEQTEV